MGRGRSLNTRGILSVLLLFFFADFGCADAGEIVGTGGWEYRACVGNVEADDLEVSPLLAFPVLTCEFWVLKADWVCCRMYQQRFTTAAIIAVLVLLILVVLYSKFRG